MLSSDDLTMRPATPDDLPTLDALTHLAFRRGVHDHALRRWSITVAEKNQAVAGYVLADYNLSPKSIGIYTVVVHPEFRRAQIATQLIETVQAAAVVSGRAIKTVVSMHNLPALALFQSTGFAIVDTLGHNWKIEYRRRSERVPT